MAGELHDEITQLQRLKQEHAGLLHQIASDAGMSADLRQELVAHIYEEEDEHVAKIAALTGGGSLSAHAPLTLPAPPTSGALTVGSLRPSPAPTSSGSVGSLRPTIPIQARAGSVGSLWRG